MKEKVITLLNKGRSAELGSIAQYMIHHYELEDQDFGKLAARVKEVAIVEMKHAEKLAERILFLGGSPRPNRTSNPKRANPSRRFWRPTNPSRGKPWRCTMKRRPFAPISGIKNQEISSRIWSLTKRDT